MFVKRSKCAFGERSVAYLGHVISVVGASPWIDKRYKSFWIGRCLAQCAPCTHSSGWSATIAGSSATTTRSWRPSQSCCGRRLSNGAATPRWLSAPCSVH
jgi:hypothetical protein